MIDIYNRQFYHLEVTKIQPLTHRPHIFCGSAAGQPIGGAFSRLDLYFLNIVLRILWHFQNLCWIWCSRVFSSIRDSLSCVYETHKHIRLLCNDSKAVYMVLLWQSTVSDGGQVGQMSTRHPVSSTLERRLNLLLLISTHETNTCIGQLADIYLLYWSSCITMKWFPDISLTSTNALMLVALLKIEPRWL